jgi:hypothetical protein
LIRQLVFEHAKARQRMRVAKQSIWSSAAAIARATGA